jgi:hypothetical protein
MDTHHVNSGVCRVVFDENRYVPIFNEPLLRDAGRKAGADDAGANVLLHICSHPM